VVEGVAPLLARLAGLRQVPAGDGGLL
jgi:hypothetical protein